MATNCLNIKVLDNIKVKEFLLTLLQENRHSAYTHRSLQAKKRNSISKKKPTIHRTNSTFVFPHAKIHRKKTKELFFSNALARKNFLYRKENVILYLYGNT